MSANESSAVPATLEQALARISELEAELATLKRTSRARELALAESERQFAHSRGELGRITKAKAEFVAIAAHELRTPMTSIIGYLELALEGRYGELAPGLEARLGTVLRNARRLMRLVAQMLDVSRLETGRIELESAPCMLQDIVEDVADELRPLAEKKGHTLATRYEACLELEADADKLHQVVNNLVSNAIRYTSTGGTIQVIVDDAPRVEYPGQWARIRVIDNGIGIPRDSIERIFEPFSELGGVAHHTSSEPDSAGLGLYIARAFVELHGGLITVDSVEGQYTEFTILLPR